MIRYEIVLPESGCRMTGVADSEEQVTILRQMGWKCRVTGEVPVVGTMEYDH